MNVLDPGDGNGWTGFDEMNQRFEAAGDWSNNVYATRSQPSTTALLPPADLQTEPAVRVPERLVVSSYRSTAWRARNTDARPSHEVA